MHPDVPAPRAATTIAAPGSFLHVAAPGSFLLVAALVVATAVAVLAVGLPGPAMPPVADAGGVAAAASTVDASVTPDEPASFTLAELAAGGVSVDRFTAFWDAELARLAAAPCPAPAASGSTVVTFAVGATPPAGLGSGYPDYAPLLDAARAAAAARCG